MNLTKLHLRPIALAKKNITDSAIRRLIVDAGNDVDDLMILCRADITTKNENKIKKYLGNFERVEEAMKNVKLRDELKNFQPPIDGLEIMKVLKLKAGKDVGIYITWVQENDQVKDIDYPKEWSAGNTALYLACQEGAEEIYMLGFDGSDYSKPINNVY